MKKEDILILKWRMTKYINGIEKEMDFRTADVLPSMIWPTVLKQVDLDVATVEKQMDVCPI